MGEGGNINREIKILMSINILCSSASFAFLSIVGPLIRALNLAEWHAGVMVATSGVAWVLIARYWGRKSDLVGRKIILGIGVLGVAISYLLMAIYVNFAIISPPAIIFSFLALVATRGAMGAFYAAITPVSNALIADHVEKKRRTAYISKLAASNGLGMVIGPTVGGFLAYWGLATPLYVFSALPFIGAVVLIKFLTNEKPTTNDTIPPPKVFDKRLRLPMLIAFLVMYSIMTVQICFGFYSIDRLGLDLVESAKFVGYIFSSIGLVFVCSQIFVSKTSFEPRQLLMFGSSLGFFSYILISSVATKLSLLLGASVGAFGVGMIFPAFQALALNGVSKYEQGVASGTVSVAQGIGTIIAPIVSTNLYAIKPELAFWAVVISYGIIFISAFSTYRK